MEFRVLRYFLAVAREESITSAAESLHLSQPTLSRQLRELEEELGKPLMIRGSRKITLTDEGMYLKKRAEEILDLVKKTEHILTFSEDVIGGDIYIGAGETNAVHFLTRTARQLQTEYPLIRYHISSGDTSDVMNDLDKGLIDFGLLFDPIDLTKYNAIHLPVQDTWGVLMRRDSPLAKQESISPTDLWDKPLIVSRHAKNGESTWLKKDLAELNIVATYSLVFNASLMVEDGMGYALCLDKIINVTGDSDLCFRPISPETKAGMNIVWKKYQVFSKAAEKFLQELRKN